MPPLLPSLNEDIDCDVIERALHAANNMVVITDVRREGHPIVWVNDHFCAFTGYERREVVGRNCRFLQGDDRDQPARARIRAAIEAGESVNVLIRNYKKDGSLFYNDLFMSPVRGDDGAVTHFIGVQNDVTAREEARALLVDHDRDVYEATERERERFGMDLHDGLNQSLVGLRMMATALHDDLVEEGSTHEVSAGTLVKLASHTIEEVRGMARGLNPVAPSREGLYYALQHLAEQADASTARPTVTAALERVPIPDRRSARHLYRIAQEAVQNALKHADAAEVCVVLRRDAEGLLLEIRDDGVGMPPLTYAPLAPGVRTEGSGLHTMAFRASLIDATLDVDSGPDGTVVRVRRPATACTQEGDRGVRAHLK